MTLSQALDYVRTRMNAKNDTTYFTNEELYALITAACNEILGVLGLIEALDTSITTVASTQSYAFPTNVVSIKKLLYNGYPVMHVSPRQAETLKEGNVVATGRPEYWYDWNRTIYFVPKPSEAVTVTLFCEKMHSFIDNSAQTTIDLPAVLHFRMLDRVLGMMYGKDLNVNMMGHYEQMWNTVHIPAIFQYKMMMKYRGQSPSVVDADSTIESDLGIV